jgi:glycosyltransferase involved in cell wall biosynthesis
MTNSSLVSVIITCYNQGRFLGDAIESVLKQSHRPIEIVVVDDGSTDDSSQVARKYLGVELIRQSNAGLAAARNAGLNSCRGDFVVFLDADDRLLPLALETGTDRLNAHSNCAFAYGSYSLITEEGMPIHASRRDILEGEPYLRLLRSNYIGMHATVMYRRGIFDEVGRFDTSLAACEDYDMFLRITRNHPIYCHGQTIAEYRQHGSNMSLNLDLMLRHALLVLGSQWEYVRRNRPAREAYRAGTAHWRDYYGEKLLGALGSRVRARQWKQAIAGGLTLLRYHPLGLADKAGRALLRMTTRDPGHSSIKASR